MSDRDSESIEERLQREADGLLEACVRHAPVSGLLAIHRRRVRRRRIGVCIASAAAVVGTLLAVWPDDQQKASRPPAPPTRVNQQTTDVEPLPIEIETVGKSNPAPSNRAPVSPKIVSYVGARATATPLVLVDLNGGDEPIIVSGYYIQEPARTLRMQDLTPGERYAVREVLGDVETGLASESF